MVRSHPDWSFSLGGQPLAWWLLHQQAALFYCSVYRIANRINCQALFVGYGVRLWLNDGFAFGRTKPSFNHNSYISMLSLMSR